MPEREDVIIEKLGPLLGDITTSNECHSDLKDWPSGDFIRQALIPKYADLLPTIDPKYWQTCARRALLNECGFVTDMDTDEDVHDVWIRLTDPKSREDTGSDVEPTNADDNNNDLVQWIHNGGKSNNRNLQWALMDCAPGCQFHLHAHPNLELVYCVKGELHEIRLDDDDHVLTKTFEPMNPSNEDDSNHQNNGKLKGPSLLDCSRPWKFGTLTKGNWLVNRVGTIHKSFTATNGEGCVLLTLWGGSHANILEEPTVVSKAMGTMDQKLTTHCAGCHPTTDELARISETFLPDSEKSSYKM